MSENNQFCMWCGGEWTNDLPCICHDLRAWTWRRFIRIFDVYIDHHKFGKIKWFDLAWLPGEKFIGITLFGIALDIDWA